MEPVRFITSSEVQQSALTVMVLESSNFVTTPQGPHPGVFFLQKLNHRLSRGFGIQKTTELTVVYFLAAIFVASVLALFAMLVIIVAIK